MMISQIVFFLLMIMNYELFSTKVCRNLHKTQFDIKTTCGLHFISKEAGRLPSTLAIIPTVL